MPIATTTTAIKPYRTWVRRPATRSASRSASNIVASRNRSCFSSRARFFLFLVYRVPLARLHSELRSIWCMIAETANLATVHGVVKRALHPQRHRARDHQRRVDVRIFFHSIKREQTGATGCLSHRQCGKERRTSFCVLLDRGSAV